MPTMRKIPADGLHERDGTSAAPATIPARPAGDEQRPDAGDVPLAAAGTEQAHGVYPRYPAYKESGVAWLGEVPVHWGVKRLRRICQINPSRSELQGIAGDTLVSFVPMEVIGEDGSLSRTERRALAEVGGGYTYFRDGDVLVAKITPCFENGKGALCRNLHNGIGLGTTELHVLRPGSEIDENFLFYLTRAPSFRMQGEAAMFGAAGQQRVPVDFIQDFAAPLPPLAEQRAIAAFLDRETAQINTLVAKQEALIELLEEKRRAVISHAVTRGLNAAVPMRDSGVPWLGEVPAHWETIQFRRLIDSMCDGPFGSDMKSSHYVDEGVRLIRLQNIGNGIFDDNDKSYIAEEHFNNLPGHDALPGDLLVAGLGDLNHPVGRACILPKHVKIAMVKADCFRLRLDQDRLLHSYSVLYLCSEPMRANVAVQMRGATRDRMNLTGVAQLQILVPPIAEQHKIIAYISGETTLLDTLTTRAQQMIDLLREHRTALIAAAVTGQIDVRGMVEADQM